MVLSFLRQRKDNFRVNFLTIKVKIPQLFRFCLNKYQLKPGFTSKNNTAGFLSAHKKLPEKARWQTLIP